MAQVRRLFILGVVCAFTFGSVTRAQNANPETESCQEYEAQTLALRNAQARDVEASQAEKFQIMRAKILKLCHESYWAEREEIVSDTWQYARNSPDIVDEIINRVEHDGESDEVSTILNYPRLDDILHECYPGDRAMAKYDRFAFKRRLVNDDSMAFQFGTVDGLFALYLGYRAIKGLGIFAKLVEAVRLPKFAESVLEGLTIYGGITMYQKWRSNPAIDKKASPPADENDVLITNEPSAMTVIDAVTANLTQQKIADVQNFVNQMNQRYSAVHTDIIDSNRTDPFHFDDISMQIDYYKTKCVSNIRAYDVSRASLTLQYVQMFCGNYLDAIENYLSWLQSPAVRCLNTNKGVASQTMADLRQILGQLPPQAVARD